MLKIKTLFAKLYGDGWPFGFFFYHFLLSVSFEPDNEDQLRVFMALCREVHPRKEIDPLIVSCRSRFAGDNALFFYFSRKFCVNQFLTIYPLHRAILILRLASLKCFR